MFQLSGGIAGMAIWTHGKASVDDGANMGFDGVNGSVFGYDRDAGWIDGGDGLVGLVDTLVEGVWLALEAVFVFAGGREVGGVARAGAEQGDFEAGEEEEGEVGLEVVAEGVVEGEDAGGAELAAGSLVGDGGVGVAVAEDDGSGCEGGADDGGDGLGAVGEHEGELSEGLDGADGGFGAGVEEEGADAVAEGGSAGLAQGYDGSAVGAEVGFQAAELSGFAGAVDTFEGDKEALGHLCLSLDEETFRDLTPLPPKVSKVFKTGELSLDFGVWSLRGSVADWRVPVGSGGGYGDGEGAFVALV